MSDVTEYAQEAERLLQDKPPSDPTQFDALGAVLLGEFAQAEQDRRETEDRWLQDLRQYRGKYDPEVDAAIDPNRSRAFVRKTRVKVKTVDARTADLLFPAGREKNWDIGPTPKPSLSTDQKLEIRKLLSAAMQQQAQQAQQQAQQQPGAQPAPPQPVAKPTRAMFDKAVQDWAKTRSQAMAATIDDQLVESRYKQACLKALHSGNLYGTGIIKGPLVERKVRTRFVNNGGKWTPQTESYVVPFVDYVPLWRFYPDMSVTELENCDYVYELHAMTKSDMAELATRKTFNSERIKSHVLANPDGLIRTRLVDDQLRVIGDRTASQGDPRGKYEVLERWGYLSGQQLRDVGVEVAEDRLHESFFSNVWLLPTGQVIKAVLQPINGVKWPYHLYYFDKDESSIFAEGLASIMRDDQTMLNASTRLIFDNAAITAGAQLEVTPSLLSNVERVNEVSPWKVWLRNTSNPGAVAVRAIELPSRLNELSALAQMCENNADEVTAIPRYMSGENATTGAAGTASGMSMLLGNVNIVIKDLISSWDEGITRSFITGLYYWNMQFNPDDKIKGDFDVKARGTASLVAKEVRARALNEFATMTANPLDAPYIKRDVLNRQRAEANELIDVVKTEDEIAADQTGAQAQQQQAQQIAQLQLQEAQGKTAKLMAEAELAQARSQEMLANIKLTLAKVVSTNASTAYVALQAGGVATSSPHIAPAGDEILRSSGWKDATPDPSIAQLNGPPVQADQGTTQVLNKGQSFAVEPRGGDPAASAQPNAPEPVPGLQPQTGLVGHQQGIETPAIDA